MALNTKLLLITLLAAVSSAAQVWEAGGFAGYSFYHGGSLTTPAGEGDAGLRRGVAFGAVLGHNMYRYLGGEFRYTRIDNTLRIEVGGQEARMGGESHAFHYDFLLHAAPREAWVRPYVAAGAGGKYYRGTGDERAFQPLMQYAVLTRTGDWQPLVSFGGGVKVRVSQHVMLRFDVRDYATPFPSRLIVPRAGSSAGGWLHNLVPMGGISAIF